MNLVYENYIVVKKVETKKVKAARKALAKAIAKDERAKIAKGRPNPNTYRQTYSEYNNYSG